jgi:Ankyrin repeats (many copies)
MPVQPLSSKPSLDRLRATAKDLRDFVRAGVEGAFETVREHHPRFGSLQSGSPEALRFKLADAQLTLARHHGFTSWSKMVRWVEEMRAFSRSPHDLLGDGTPRDGDELVRLACMNYGNDSARRVADAVQLWRSNPMLVGSSIFAAAAAGDHAAVTEFVSADRGAASRSGGPFDWTPLLYATYSRLVTEDLSHDFVETVRVLLRFGADPNSGFLWDGLITPFTAITGAIGRGEHSAAPHVDQLALLQLLLVAGADPNDGQAIYNAGIGNAKPTDDTDWLEVLYAHGFGRPEQGPSSGPWYKRFGDQLSEPAALVAELLHDAARRGFANRARVLLADGADPNRSGTHPVFGRRAPYQDAVQRGFPDVALMLLDSGAQPVGISAVEHAIGRCLAGGMVTDEEAAAARQHTPDLIRVACELGKPLDVIRRLVELGWDINAKNSTTALHETVMRRNLETVKVLINLGADPTITDNSFHSTPAGWAEHFGELEIKTYLDGLTT